MLLTICFCDIEVLILQYVFVYIICFCNKFLCTICYFLMLWTGWTNPEPVRAQPAHLSIGLHASWPGMDMKIVNQLSPGWTQK